MISCLCLRFRVLIRLYVRMVSGRVRLLMVGWLVIGRLYVGLLIRLFIRCMMGI